ncbi:MAG: agmatine deiminase family protein [Myxococcota bacterium]
MKGRIRIPAEWESHHRCWLAYPHLADEWPGSLEAAQQAVAALCRGIAGEGAEPVSLLVRDESLEKTARNLIGTDADVTYVMARYGDCWTRDTLPLFGDSDGQLGALLFRFNGWGEKFPMEGDDAIGAWVVERADAEPFAVDLVLEGGALEFDGEGTCLVTESCALHPDRNPGLTREAFELTLRAVAAVDRVVWLPRGLSNDHTDGHVDMVARFASPDVVLCTNPSTAVSDADALSSIVSELSDHGLSTRLLPAPTAINASNGTPLPANYCNFYVANHAVFVPQYEVPQDDEALELIADAFPDRTPVGLNATDLLKGGGAFHCVTQPEPRLL